MYNGQKVLDVHGHMSTPPHFRAYAYNLIALRSPAEGIGADIPEEALDGAQKRHLKVMDERNIDLQMLSPRPVAYMHWEAAFLVAHWTRVTNDTIHKITQMYPDRFVGIAQLPQNSKIATSNCVAELERTVNDYGFVGAIVNPDPAGDRATPGAHTEYWYPLYEKAQQLDVPLIIHPSISRDPRIEIVPHSYQINNVTEEFIWTQLMLHSDIFKTFPRLKVVVCHCGGALSRFIERDARHSGELEGMKNNLFFDTCAYDETFLTAAIKQKGVDQMLFGTEAPGSGGAIRPDTGRPSDDMVPIIDGLDFLSTEDKLKIFNGNVRKVFTRLKVPEAVAA